MSRERTATVTLSALRVVFADIGTSPLYTVKKYFGEFTGLKPIPEDVLDVLSLLTRALTIVVTGKYVVVVMRVDNRGEGGVPFDPMRTSYFVGRNSFVEAARPLLPRWQQKLFLMLVRVAANAGDFFGLPANRVVELGSRIEI